MPRSADGVGCGERGGVFGGGNGRRGEEGSVRHGYAVGRNGEQRGMAFCEGVEWGAMGGKESVWQCSAALRNGVEWSRVRRGRRGVSASGVVRGAVEWVSVQ